MPRPIGSKNEKTKQWDAFGHELIEKGMPRIHSILDTCDDETFIQLYTRLLEYFKPKMKRIETVSAESETIIIVKRTDPTPFPNADK